MYRKEIVYSRETRDYAMYLNGELIGFERTYHSAEVTLDQTVFEMLTHGDFATAAELDGGAVCPTCGDDGDCPDCDLHPLTPWELAETGYVKPTARPMLMPEGDWIDVEGMRVVAPMGGMVVVQIATEAPECKRDVLGERWTICRAPGDGPCYCDVFVKTGPPESLREDCLNVITMALGQTHGAASVVTELRRVKARLETVAGRIVALD